jgi:aspartyl-tRNA(Asn)/glutamyl-tRNA(Gln) amidotransferase subunit A
MYTFTSITNLQNDLKKGIVTCTALVEQHLAAIHAAGDLNIFLEVFDATALQQAAAVDARLKAGNAGRLAGVIVGLKDNICYKDHKASASSKILEGFVSLYSATCVQRMVEQDAIIIGRLNCDEFAMGSSNENSAFGPVKNPLDPKRVPGGSSGGAAAAVAGNFCHVTLGSDTGGSIRQPASFTGTVGIKPTYGRVSRYGLIAYASSFDQIGPITKTVEDGALVMEIISGLDAHDTTSSSKPVEAYHTQLHSGKKYRIAYLKECVFAEGLDPEVKANVLAQINALKAAGHTVEEASFPFLDYMVPVYYVITTAEASSNLARFAGVHYGYRSPHATDLESTYKKSRSEGFGKEVKRRIMLGTFVLSAGYYDAYYSKGQKVRRIIRDRTLDLLKSYDFLLTPSTPGTAFEFGKNSADPIKMYLEDIFTVQANIAGVPAISVPSGLHSNGMPMGVQLMANNFAEGDMMDIASEIKPLS